MDGQRDPRDQPPVAPPIPPQRPRQSPPSTLPPMPKQPDPPQPRDQFTNALRTAAAQCGEARSRGWASLDGRRWLLAICGGFATFALLALTIGGLSRKPATGSRVRYNVTDLGTLGGKESITHAINNNGQVVGWAYTSGGELHAFLWQADRGMQDLGTLGGGDCSGAYGINNVGQVVGESRIGGGRAHAFLWQAGRGMQDLSTLGGDHSSARAINDAGQVVGDSNTKNGDWHSHAFLWQADRGMQDLGTLGGDYSGACGINNAGQVVGYSPTGRIRTHAFLWQADRGMQDLGTLAGLDSWAEGINDAGQVVGRADTGSDRMHVFLWQADRGMQDLGTLGGEGDCSLAYRINNLGQVVGGPDYWSVSNQRPRLPAFLYSDGKVTDLNTAIDPDLGWYLSTGAAINDSGQIAVTGTNAAGQSHAFLLTPVPRQSSLALSGLAPVALLTTVWWLCKKWTSQPPTPATVAKSVAKQPSRRLPAT